MDICERHRLTQYMGSRGPLARPRWSAGEAPKLPPDKILTGQPEHVGHRVKPRLLILAPERGLHGAARENAAVFGDMRKLDPLAWPRENHSVIPDHCPAPQGGKANIAGSAQT